VVPPHRRTKPFHNSAHHFRTQSLISVLLSPACPGRPPKYVPYRQLPWEIIDEMTLRHPGYVAYVVPYEGIGHHKATLFFGVPVQNYYYKAMNDNQAAALKSQSMFGAGAQDFFSGATWNNGLLTSKLENNIQASRQKPFRQYFYLDSEHHLIDNGIITSGRDTFNAVEIAYVSDAKSAFPTRARALPTPAPSTPLPPPR
jgi:hypothetical protein